MLMKESHIKPIAVGSMLAEAMVSILALIAATSLFPLDYFQINVTPEKFTQILPQLHSLGFTQSNLTLLSAEVGEKIAGRPGGAVSLAVGMAQIFSSKPGFSSLMSYWYHFAIMFEALFILTTVDAGTRIARFILQEVLGKVYKPFGQTNWLIGNLITSLVVVFAWGYFIYTGSVTTIWPMFGVVNQLLATLALAIGTSYLVNRGMIRYSWITIIPMTFVGITTITGGVMNLINLYIPQVLDHKTVIKGSINALLTVIILVCVLMIIAEAIPKWFKIYQTGIAPLNMKNE
jgi:carbon starvation protein